MGAHKTRKDLLINVGGNSEWTNEEADRLYSVALEQQKLLDITILTLKGAIQSDNLPQIHTGLAILLKELGV